MLWLMIGLFALALLVGAIAQRQRRRHPPFDPTSASSDFPNDDHPWYRRSGGQFIRMRKP